MAERKSSGRNNEYGRSENGALNLSKLDIIVSPPMDAAQQRIGKDKTRSTNTDHEPPPPTPKFIYWLTLLAAVGGFLFGYDTGVISGAMLLLKPAFQLSSEWQEIIVSITVGAAALFAFIGGYVSEVFGRRPVIFAASFIFAAGSLLLGLAYNRAMLVTGRFIVGAGIGLASMTVPMYIAEASPPELRGRLVTMNSLFITGGQFVSGILDGAFSYAGPDGWRYMLGLAAVPAVLQFIGFIFMPESPRWLIERGRYDLAKRVLLQIRGSKQAAEEEFEIVKQTFEDDERERQEKGGKFVVLTMLRTPHLRRALIVGCGLQLFQQAAGINTVMYYSATIIRMAGVKDTKLAIWLSSVTGLVNFLFTFLGMYLVEKIGRRLLTLGSLFFVTLSLLLLGIGFHLIAVNSPPLTPEGSYPYPMQGYDHCWLASSCGECIRHPECGYCFYENASQPSYDGICLPTNSEANEQSLTGACSVPLALDNPLTWAYEWCPNNYAWLTMLGLVVYLVSFAPGMGPMPWTINSEIYPQWARSAGNSLSTATNWTFNLIIAMTYLTLMETITKQGAYYLYAGIAFIGLIFFFLFLPETKGKTLEQLESIFVQPWFNSRHSGGGCLGPGIAASNPGFQYVHIRGHNRQFYCEDDEDELASYSP